MFISDTIKTDRLTITPRLAKQLLEQNTGNRKIKTAGLETLKSTLLRGEWEFNGEAIKIAKDGRVLDGQHRLLASAETGIPFETMIVYGLNDSTQETMDIGTIRLLPDILYIRGYKNTNRIASITVAIIRSEKWNIRSAIAGGANKFTVTNKEATDRLEREPSLVDLGAIVHPIAKLGVPQRTGGLLYYKFSEISSEDTQYFFEKLETGVGLGEGDPILALRNALIAIKSNAKGQTNQVYIGALIIKAWNKFRDGEPVSQLRFRIGGASPESFPEPH